MTVHRDLTITAVRNQLTAMCCESYDLGLRVEDKLGMINHKGLSACEVGDRIQWLKAKNLAGSHVYIRPHGSMGLILVDDISHGTIELMKVQGVVPALVVETSPDNFQVWVRVSNTPLDFSLATQVARILAKRFNGDLASADWSHYGRLAGFTNRKPAYVDGRGYFPYSKLHSPRSGELCTDANNILSRAKRQLRARARKITEETQGLSSPLPTSSSRAELAYQSLASQIEARYSPKVDYSRLDWMVVKSMLLTGYSEAEIAFSLLKHSPNLDSRKGDYQERYVARTVKAAREKIKQDLQRVQGDLSSSPEHHQA